MMRQIEPVKKSRLGAALFLKSVTLDYKFTYCTVYIGQILSWTCSDHTDCAYVSLGEKYAIAKCAN
jgi:hypothetical protein